MTLREAGELYDDTVQKISQVTSNAKILAETVRVPPNHISLDERLNSTVSIRREIVLSIIEQLNEYKKTLNRYLDMEHM